MESLVDQKEELEGALQQQAELTAEVAVLEREYGDMLAKAHKAMQLQEELPKLQVRGCWVCVCASVVVEILWWCKSNSGGVAQW